ncbi:MAG: NAD-dependent epimerase/dehydratase family protein [Calditrichaeota bacterium]|nr:NAD-dependent epimerase/dehydratase family protein [Calditrichota bacterium]
MRILLTGGAGFIGSHLAEKLLERGDQVVCLDNFNDYYDPAVKRRNIAGMLEHPAYTLVEGDILDEKLLTDVFEANTFDAIVHLAARAGVRPSIQQPLLYEQVNVRGTQLLLEQARAHEVPKFIFASSSSVYGANKKVPFSETDFVDNPVSPYAATKKAGELICYTYHHLYDISCSCLRFFTVYGPRQRPDMAIHKFTRLIDAGEPVPMFGDGSSRRDYTYIDDVLQGVIQSIDRCEGYEIYNLGESQTIALRDLISKLETLLGKKARIQKLPPQPGDVPITYADISKAREKLGYNPQFPLDEGLERFVRWFKEEKKAN